jgi:hypothetical protein
MIAHHALVLNLHQPSGNLDYLLDHNEWEAREILFALDRIPRSLWGYEDLARVHLSMSGTLLEALSNSEFQRRVYGIVDCGTLLWRLQNNDLFEMLGTGYYHPVLPLIPEADRHEHLHRWLGIAHHLFWRPRFDGFWPPEMGFSMDMIPLLRAHGFRYVLVDSERVEAVSPMSWQELRYRPHIARHGKDEIIVVVRDRDLSNAQESGMEVDWFLNEVAERTKWCDFPPSGHDSQRRRERRLVSQHHRGGQLLERLLRADVGTGEGWPGRGLTDLHQRLPEGSWGPWRGPGPYRGLEHRRSRRQRLRSVDRLWVAEGGPGGPGKHQPGGAEGAAPPRHGKAGR